MLTLSNQLKAQREEQARLSKELLLEKLKAYPDYIKSGAKDVKRLIGLQYNLRPDSQEVENIYNQWSTALQDPALQARIAAGEAIQLTTTAPRPMEDRTQPPVRQPPPVQPTQAEVSGKTAEEVTTQTGGKMSYPEFRKLLMKDVSEGAKYPLEPGAWGTKYYQAIQQSPEEYNPNASADEMMRNPAWQAYKFYQTNEAAPEEVTGFFAGTKGIGPTPPQYQQMRKEDAGMRTQTRTVERENVPLASVENGVFRPKADMKNAVNRKEVFSQLKNQIYPDMSDKQFKESVWNMNKEQLTQRYGGVNAARKAFENGDAFTQESGVRLLIAEPVDLTISQVAQMDGANTTTVKRTEVAERAASGALNTLQRNSSGRRFMTPEEIKAEGDQVLGRIGHLAKVINTPEGYARVKKHLDRVAGNFGGYDALLGQMQTADKDYLEKQKLALEAARIQADIEAKRAGVVFKERELALKARELQIDAQKKMVDVELASRGQAISMQKVMGDFQKRATDYKNSLIKADPGKAQWNDDQWLQDPGYQTVYKDYLTSSLMAEGYTYAQAKQLIKPYEKQMELGIFQQIGNLLPIQGLHTPSKVKAYLTPEEARRKGYAEAGGEETKTGISREGALLLNELIEGESP
jgi:hypothetical protein